LPYGRGKLLYTCAVSSNGVALTGKDGKVIIFEDGRQTASVDGVIKALTAAPAEKDGVLYVPLRFLAENLGVRMDWEPFGKIVTLTPGAFVEGETAPKEYITIVDSAVSGAYDNAPGLNTYDGSTDTLWSVDCPTPQWIVYDLKDVQPIQGVSVMWNKNNVRKAKFNIEVSDDGRTWNMVYGGAPPDYALSAGLIELAYEDYDFPAGTEGRYIRVNLFGTTVGTFSAIIEFRAYKPPAPARYLPIVNSFASGAYDNAPTAYAYDGSVDTLWSVDCTTPQWIVYDFGKPVGIDAASIMWNKNNVRKAKFNIEVSGDGQTWQLAYGGYPPDYALSAGLVEFAYEDYKLAEGSEGRYLRINLYGSTTGTFSAIIESRFLGHEISEPPAYPITLSSLSVEGYAIVPDFNRR